MKDHFDSKAAAWEAHSAEFDCSHESTGVRERTIRGGSTQYVEQCLRCGEAAGNAIRKSDFKGAAPPPFDVELAEAWVQRRRESAEAIKRSFDRTAFFASYDVYLASPEWAAKRKKVMARAKGVCEGCGDRPPTEVHHLTYAHVSNEFLFELVALCHDCHERLHDE